MIKCSYLFIKPQGLCVCSNFNIMTVLEVSMNVNLHGQKNNKTLDI